MDSGLEVAAGLSELTLGAGVPLLTGEPGSPPGRPPGSFIPRRALNPPPSLGTTGADAVFVVVGRKFGGNLNPAGPANPPGESAVEPVDSVVPGTGRTGGAPCRDR